MNAKHDDWTPCPRGEIGKMVERIRSGRRQTVLARSAIVAVFVVALAVGIGTAARLRSGRLLDGEQHVADISCQDCGQMMTDYEHGKLSDEDVRRVSNHLDHCPGCRRHYQKAKGHDDGDTTRSECSKNLLVLSECFDPQAPSGASCRSRLPAY